MTKGAYPARGGEGVSRFLSNTNVQQIKELITEQLVYSGKKD